MVCTLLLTPDGQRRPKPVKRRNGKRTGWRKAQVISPERHKQLTITYFNCTIIKPGGLILAGLAFSADIVVLPETVERKHRAVNNRILCTLQYNTFGQAIVIRDC